MTHSRTVELDGHIIDSGAIQRCFGAVMDLGGSFDVDTVLAGSIRDDDPLPDAVTDSVEAQDAIREQVHDADGRPAEGDA